MDDEFLGHELEEWYPMEPQYGPPLPRWLNIFWPWYKAPTPPPPGLASLYGKVTDFVSGVAVPSAAVSLDSVSGATDSNGNYQFLNFSPGAYTATFSKEGYQSQTLSIALVEGTNELNVALRPPTPTPSLANLYGVVTNAVTNQPIAAATVSIMYTDIGTTTDQSGHFEFLNLPIGVYVISVEASGYESFMVNVTVTEGDSSLHIKLDPVVAPPPTQTGIMKLRVRTVGDGVESEVTFANLTGRAWRLNIPNADFFYVNAYSSPLGPGFRIFRMNVGDIVPEGISVWHGSVDSWALQELSGKTCIADCHFWPADCHQSFQGIVSSSWQEWQEIPYQPPWEPPAP